MTTQQTTCPTCGEKPRRGPMSLREMLDGDVIEPTTDPLSPAEQAVVDRYRARIEAAQVAIDEALEVHAEAEREAVDAHNRLWQLKRKYQHVFVTGEADLDQRAELDQADREARDAAQVCQDMGARLAAARTAYSGLALAQQAERIAARHAELRATRETDDTEAVEERRAATHKRLLERIRSRVDGQTVPRRTAARSKTTA